MFCYSEQELDIYEIRSDTKHFMTEFGILNVRTSSVALFFKLNFLSIKLCSSLLKLN